MSQEISRRSFIAVIGGVGAGLMLGCFADAQQPVKEGLTPNAIVHISPTGEVTITVARPDMGQGTRTAFAMLVAEELDADWKLVRVAQAPGNEALYGSQGAGGSSSVRAHQQRLRDAGATARAMLVTAAAQKWQVDPAVCRTEGGRVLHPEGKLSLGYGELATTAAALPVPKGVGPKHRKDYRLIGKAISGVDVPKMVNGTAIFGLDSKPAGTVVAVVAHRQVLGSKVEKFNDSKARRVAGVLDVVAIPSGVAVVGADTWSALQGYEALEVSWSTGEAIASTAISQQLKAAIADHLPAPSGAKSINATVDFPFLAHAPMEPMNATASVKDDRCEVWVPTQSPGSVQGGVARALGLRPENVTVHVPLTGGGFGGRHGSIYAEEAALLSKHMGKPVQVLWTREEDMRNDAYRPMSHHAFLGSYDAAGNVTGWSHQAVIVNSRSGNYGSPEMPYDIPGAGLARRRAGAAVPTGAWRSVEHTQVDVANEMFFDEIAKAAGQDPLALRLKLIKDERLKKVLTVAAEKGDWSKPLSAGKGRGLACFTGYGSCSAFVVEVTVDKDLVKVDRVTCAVDAGIAINVNGVKAQMEGGCVDGLSTALKSQVTIEGGRIEQENFGSYGWLTMQEMPSIEITIVESEASFGGLGEVGYPPSIAAVANAVAAATGKRVRRFPIVVSELA